MESLLNSEHAALAVPIVDPRFNQIQTGMKKRPIQPGRPMPGCAAGAAAAAMTSPH